MKKDLRKAADPDKAAFLPRFFKTGPGEYAEGDKFLGVVVPAQRKIAKKYSYLDLSDIQKLLRDPIHECRLTALFILVNQFEKGDATVRQKIVDLYLRSIDGVNNWDLVDSSAPKIFGAYLYDKDRSLLYTFARAKHLWKQRVSIIATQYFIRRGDYRDTLKIAEILLTHPHDLIHKAVGWMLREVGDQNQVLEESFLKKHYRRMPRTMLRYAIEKFPSAKRKRYLKA